MKWINMVRTADGKLHDNALKAEKHAEAVYGLALTKLAAELVRIDKYGAMAEYVDQNLERFCELKSLKADIALEKTEEAD